MNSGRRLSTRLLRACLPCLAALALAACGASGALVVPGHEKPKSGVFDKEHKNGSATPPTSTPDADAAAPAEGAGPAPASPPAASPTP